MLNAIVSLACFLSFIFTCWPRERIWNPMAPGRCMKTESFMLASVIANVISDVAILVLPLASVMSLQMPLKRKIGVSAIFATGIL